MIRVAILTTDSREHYRDYENPRPYFGSAPAALLDGLAHVPGVEVHVLSCLQQPLAAPEKLADNLWYHGLHVPNWGWLKTGYLGCVRAVRRQLREIEPDLVHGQGTERDCALAAVLSGYPNLVTIHGNMRRVAEVNQARALSYTGIMARLEGWVVPRTGGVLCITRYTESLVEKEARRTWVVPNAVDQDYFAVQPASHKPPMALCVGTICLHKNQNRLIEELDHLPGTIEVQFLGGLDETSTYGQRFLELVRDRSWCQYEGFADHARLRRALSEATMLVLPSLEDNCPMVVLESMAAGLPIVAVRVGGVPDLIEDEETGFLVGQGDWKEFRKGVQRLLEHPKLRKSMGQAGRERARRLFHPEVVARKHLEVYEDLLRTSS